MVRLRQVIFLALPATEFFLADWWVVRTSTLYLVLHLSGGAEAEATKSVSNLMPGSGQRRTPRYAVPHSYGEWRSRPRSGSYPVPKSAMGRLSMRPRPLDLNQALASDKLEEFVRQEEARGAELVQGSDFERALALLITQRGSRSDNVEARLRTRVSRPSSKPPIWSPSLSRCAVGR
jgi:hypothetical protein